MQKKNQPIKPSVLLLLLIIVVVALISAIIIKTKNNNRLFGEGKLETKISIPSRSYNIGDSVKAMLYFKNVGTNNLRIYLVNSETFRYSQSTIEIVSKKTNKLIDIQPGPQPHGYEVTEKDFHLVKPGEEIKFEQSIQLRKDKFTSGEEYFLRWIYSNDITKWPGNAPTLDGLTQELFEGKTIPYIWTGKLTVETNILVQ